MGRQHAHSSGLSSITGIAVAGIGILVLLGNVDWAVSQMKNCLCANAIDTLGIFPCILLSACPAMQAYVLEQHGLLGWLLHSLLTCGPLLSVLQAAI
jgi:hypothetical protein